MKQPARQSSMLDDPDMQGVMPALLRAARRAHKIAHQTGTYIVTMRDGKVVHVPPDPAMYNDDEISKASPYTITPHMLTRVEQIGEALGRAEAAEVSQDLRLRRINRIRTIQGSLAIEGNTLSEEQIATLLDGKPVIAPLKDIQEARNAIQAYDQYLQWSPVSETDLLKAHGILMTALLDTPGHYRMNGVAVTGQNAVHHFAPPARRVPQLMADLLAWLDATDAHPLIASSVFHYEFEFIHPFADGNGRLGRLWQTLILSRWKTLFAYVPVESLVHAAQSDYYAAIRQSSAQGESTPFISFMLDIILDAVNTPQETPQLTPQVKRLLTVLDGEMSRQEIQQAMGLKDRKSLRERYLLPALQGGYIEMTYPDTPNARNQRYRLTARGQEIR